MNKSKISLSIYDFIIIFSCIILFSLHITLEQLGIYFASNNAILGTILMIIIPIIIAIISGVLIGLFFNRKYHLIVAGTFAAFWIIYGILILIISHSWLFLPFLLTIVAALIILTLAYVLSGAKIKSANNEEIMTEE